MEVRPEIRADERAVDEVVRFAFGGREEEPALVRDLRAGDGYVADLSLVALRGGSVVGHAMFTVVELVPDDDGAPAQPVLALAPLAVHPDHQHQGVGRALVERGVRRASRRNEPFVVVVGSDRYYPRFGFVPASRHGVRAPFPVEDAHFMLRPLPAFRTTRPGTVRYPGAFAGTT